MIKKIVEGESEESGVLVPQLLEVRVFGGVHDLILECLIHFSYILVDSLSFIMLKLELVLEGSGGVRWYHGVYSRSVKVVPYCGN